MSRDFPYIEIYHDGDTLAVARIERIIEGHNPFPGASHVTLILKDYSIFGGADFRKARFRETVDKFVDNYNFEYWRCTALQL